MRLRLVPLALIVASPAVARADKVLEGAEVKWELQIPDDNASGGFRTITANQSDFELEHRFNYARCLCGQLDPAPPDTMFHMKLSWKTPPATSVQDPLEIWQGLGCDTSTGTTLEDNCGTGAKATIAHASALANVAAVDLNVYDQIQPNGSGCSSTKNAYTSHIYAMTDPDGNRTFDDVFSYDVDVDTELPPVPSTFDRAAGGENAIELRWQSPTTDATDIDHWQLLCATADGDDPFPTGPAKRWDSPLDFCSGTGIPQVPIDVIGLTPSASGASAMLAGPIDAGLVDAGLVDAAVPPDAGTTLDFLPAPLQDLDKDYVCAEASSTATSIRVEGLENGTPYYFVLLAVDKAGNARGVTFSGALTPQPVTDFWEGLHEGGSNVEGGFCLIADTYGDGGGPGGAITDAMRAFRDDTLASSSAGRAFTRFYYQHLAGAGELAHRSLVARVALALALLPAIALAFLWHLLTLPGLLALLAALLWLGRPRTAATGRRGYLPGRAVRLAATAAAAALALVASGGAASAQNFAPYWDDGTDIATEGGPEAVHWHVGIKMGPYVPGIDAQLGDGEGHGPYHRFFGGYNILPILEVDYVIWHPPGGQLLVGGSGGALGKTGQAFSMDGSPSEGDQTKFRLLPLAANAAYRLTMLDDEYGIPVIPYLRAGLSYYIWWITKPSGDLAVVDMDNKARGASLGLQGSAGLAVRAERIDPPAAASMHDSGIFHAGFYAEYQVGWVDGFGSDKKLAVGDSTWFAGVDFEF